MKKKNIKKKIKYQLDFIKSLESRVNLTCFTRFLLASSEFNNYEHTQSPNETLPIIY
jgi:hypothetical protein